MKIIKDLFDRWFVKAMSNMALGLFSSLIIGLIISQIAKIPALSFLTHASDMLAASSPVVGAAIGVAIAYGLKADALVIFSSAASGAIGYAAGGPVGAYIGGLIGAEIGNLVSKKTPVDIIVTPITTILSGGLISYYVGGPINSFMTFLGDLVNNATVMEPLPMGILVAVIVGLVLTAPISSAALCIMLGLNGIAAGAAAVGCSAQMVGFAVAGLKDNKWGSLFSVGLGTSMLQFGNILKHPQIWLAPTLASAILGPISTCVFKMTNTSTGAGMGTSGLVGQFGAFAAMSADGVNGIVILLQLLLMHFILPAVLTLIFDRIFRKCGIIKDGYMKLSV